MAGRTNRTGEYKHPNEEKRHRVLHVGAELSCYKTTQETKMTVRPIFTLWFGSKSFQETFKILTFSQVIKKKMVILDKKRTVIIIVIIIIITMTEVTADGK